MKITCEFCDYEEMMGFAGNLLQREGPAQAAKSTGRKVQKESPGKPEPEKVEIPKGDPEPAREEAACTLVDIRAKLAELQKSGKREQVKELLESFGASRLSEVPSEKYAELIKKAGEL